MLEFLSSVLHLSWFEIGMLLCFASSWPFSIYKTWRLKQGTEKSTVFLGLLILGYFFGIIHKFLYKFDVVILLYGFNLGLVLWDLLLSLYYRRKNRKKTKKAGQ